MLFLEALPILPPMNHANLLPLQEIGEQASHRRGANHCGQHLGRTYPRSGETGRGRNCSILLRKSSMTMTIKESTMMLVTKTRSKALTLIESCSNRQPLAV